MALISIYRLTACVVSLLLFSSFVPLTHGATAKEETQPSSKPSVSPVTDKGNQDLSDEKSERGEEQVAVIAPYRSAEISTEVRGVIEEMRFKEGDLVEKGQVMAVISKRKYLLTAQRALNALKAAEADLKRARQEARVKEVLLCNKATTNTEVLKAKADEEVAEFRLAEAKDAMELAGIEVEACEVKAPFSGYVALRFKEPFESVDYQQKLFVVVDSSKVYAIAGVTEKDVADFTKDRRVAFIPSPGTGRGFVGAVERVGKLLDPKSGTKKVYVILDNPDGQLEIGMAGALEPAK